MTHDEFVKIVRTHVTNRIGEQAILSAAQQLISSQNSDKPIVIKTVRPVNFERWLTDNFTWNGAGWVSGVPSIVKSTETLYQDYMRTFYPQLLEA